MANREVQFFNGATQLPNGDIWTGFKRDEQRPDNVENVVVDASDAVSQMLAAQTGQMLNCNWCGMQFSRKQLNELREHVETNHQNVFGSTESEKAALVAALNTEK
jgi:hypothetical protein